MQQIIDRSLASVAKTLDHIIVSNINKHLAFESILANCQHGFRSQRSCETQLVQFFHDLVSNLDRAMNRNHRQTDVIIMDFPKAFDKVPHRRLLYKLYYYGIRESTHKWITLWLSERSQKVVLDGQASDPVPVLSDARMDLHNYKATKNSLYMNTLLFSNSINVILLYYLRSYLRSISFHNRCYFDFSISAFL